VFLEKEYLPEHNRRFARAAAKSEDYHRRAPRASELDRIFRLESPRTIYNDWVVRYDNRFFQLERQSRHYAPAQGQVLVCEGRHGSIAIEYRGRGLQWCEIPAPLRPSVSEVKPTRERERVTPQTKQKWAPPANHPWREAVRREVQKRALHGAAEASIIDLASAAPSGLRRASLRARSMMDEGRTTNIQQKKGTLLSRQGKGHFKRGLTPGPSAWAICG
jgi:hypothetical protein